MSNMSFPTQSNLRPQTSTLFPSMMENSFSNPNNFKNPYQRPHETSQSAHKLTSIPSTTGRTPNFGTPTHNFNNNFPKKHNFPSLIENVSDMGQTTDYILHKLRTDSNFLMEVEVSDFTTNQPQEQKMNEGNMNLSFLQNIVQNIEIPKQKAFDPQAKASNKEKYAQPKRKNPTLIK